MRNWFVTMAAIALLTTLAGVALAETTPLNAKAEDGILVFQSTDGQFKWWFDARAYIDMAMYFDDGPLWYDDDGSFAEDRAELQNSLAGGIMVRRARLALKSQLWGDWYGEVDMDFAEEGAALKDAYLSYRGLFNGSGRVRVGNFRTPFGLEEVTTSRNLMFMERSMGTDPFVVGRRLGLEVTRWSDKYRASVAAFGGDVEDFYKESNENVSFAARVNYTPIRTDESTLMIGASGTMQKPTFVDFDIKVNTRPETNVSDTKFVYAKYSDVDKYNVFGGELAYVNKRFMLQGEYMLAKYTFLDPDSDPDVSNSGGYVFASYFLTDDTHNYDHKDAEFTGVKPRNKGGAWEVAVRYSTIDLNDEDADTMYGSATSVTLGVNYFPNPNVKLMMNYGMVNNDEYATGRGDFNGDYDFEYLSMRFQTAF